LIFAYALQVILPEFFVFEAIMNHTPCLALASAEHKITILGY